MRLTCVSAIVWGLALSWNVKATDLPAPARYGVETVIEELTVEAPGPRYAAAIQRDRIGRVLVPITIDGRGPFKFVIDTGATSSAIVSSAARRLGLRPDPGARVRVQGATGVDTVSYVTTEQMELGELLFKRAKLLIVPDVFGGADGVLGVRGLPDMCIRMDFRNELTEIEYARNKQRPPGEWLEFSSAPGQLARLELRVGGVHTKAVIDTGAQQTIGNDRLRKALLLRGRTTQDADIVGVTMDVTQAKSIRIHALAFGSVIVRSVAISFGELPVFDHWRLNSEPALLLGMDVIEKLEAFEIDYQQRKLHLRPRSGESPHGQKQRS